MADYILEELLEAYYYMPDVIVWRLSEAKIISACANKYYKGGKVLDIGCGDGIFGALTIDKIDAGIDISINELKKAKPANGVYKYLACGSVVNMPFKDGSFDFIFSNCVFEHLADLKAALGQTRMALAPSGKLVLTIPSKGFADYFVLSRLFRKLGLNNLAKSYKNFRIKRLNIKYLLNIEEWGNILNTAGFDLVESGYYIPNKAAFLFAVFHEFGLARNCKWLKKLTIFLLRPILRSAGQDYDLRSGMGLWLVAVRRGLS